MEKKTEEKTVKQSQKSRAKGKKKKNKKNQTHFSLVELSCAIIILLTLLSMGIIGFSNLLTKNKMPKLTPDEIAINATKKYLKENPDKYPQIVGEWTNISLNSLNKVSLLSKYLDEFKKDSCLEKSYVRVYKYAQEKYSLVPYLICKNNSIKETEYVPEPIIDAYFIDEDDNLIKNELLDLKKDKIKLYLSGGINNDSSIIDINSYNYSISIKTYTNKEWNKIYDTNYLIPDDNSVIDFTESLSEYIKDESTKEVKVDIRLINVVGMEKTVTLHHKVQSSDKN